MSPSISEAEIEVLRNRLRHAKFPERHLDKNLLNFETPTQRHAQALASLKAFGAKLRSSETLPASCALLYGNTGTGKTHLAIGVVKMMGVKHSVKYATVSDLAREVRSTYSKLATQTESGILHEHVKPSMLVLDEIGVGMDTEHEKLMMHDVLARRYDARRPTIMISNMRIDEVKKALGDRIVDRIKEDRGIMIQFDWESWRGK